MVSKKSAVIIYLPVLHKGYIDYLKKNKNSDVFVLSRDFLKDFTSVERDLRVIDPKLLIKSLKSFDLKKVYLLKKNQIAKIVNNYQKIFLPDEDVMRGIAIKFLPKEKVFFNNIFLRWDRKISTTEFVVPADRKITNEAFHVEMIKKAGDLSHKSADWWRKIGALIVKDGKILASAYNTHLPSHYHLDTFGDPRSNFDAGERFDLVLTIHAEAKVISDSAREGISLKGADLYVTTFPCPVCARLVGNSGIKRVFYKKGYSLMDAEKILKHFDVEIILVDES